jgi:ABC-type Zn uptake system ZnuABC Zn-binding protein ZnuA
VPASPSAEKISVIATTTQLEDVVSVIAGDRVTVIGLVPRNGDPHEFEPTPETVRQVAESKAVFINGAGLEGWLEELVKNAGGERPLFDTSSGLTLSTIDRAFEEGGETDPHIWMSPVNMLTVVDNVVAGLKKIDPDGASVYDANATEYKARLKELDVWAENELSFIPVERRKLVTAHDAMGYFAARYNFEIIGYVIPSVSTEAAETSAKDLAALVDLVKASGVPTIFAEATINPKFMDQVAAEAKVKVDELYVDSLGDKGGEAGTYLDFFRFDVNTIVAGLK